MVVIPCLRNSSYVASRTLVTRGTLSARSGRTCADRPGRRGRHDGAVGLNEVAERLAQIGHDLGPDLVDPVAPHPQDLRGRAEVHVELNRLVEVVADPVREVLARQ